MKVLSLGPGNKEIQEYIEAAGDDVFSFADRLVCGQPPLAQVDFVVSYGYRYIIKKEIIDVFQDKPDWQKGQDAVKKAAEEKLERGLARFGL
jgi:methionyl-tRNA formyltransferase